MKDKNKNVGRQSKGDRPRFGPRGQGFRPQQGFQPPGGQGFGQQGY